MVMLVLGLLLDLFCTHPRRPVVQEYKGKRDGESQLFQSTKGREREVQAHTRSSTQTHAHTIRGTTSGLTFLGGRLLLAPSRGCSAAASAHLGDWPRCPGGLQPAPCSAAADGAQVDLIAGQGSVARIGKLERE